MGTQSTFLLVIIAIFLIAIIVLMMVLIKFIKNDDIEHKVAPKSAKQATPKKETSIKDLISIASDSKKSKDDLAMVVSQFIEEFKFPQKQNGKAPQEAGIYLNLVLLICSHKNADAKIITALNAGLKKKNPEYVVEIEEYESQGVENRKNRAR
ncbi:fatty-acid--CoA ligase [Campylobacter sp. 7477a]|uniref:fatty-acid--CoA ligase n=1 Tax=Campylobacter sp. 7477a TaxID=2735741 RepID=UPI003015271A|nr:fatty-acid--CoA ligase [Campylobacter sp. 7477a]